MTSKHAPTDLSTSPTRIRVLKFGGTSVADAERLQRVAKVVAETSERCAGDRPLVVVSALGGATDQLIDTAQQAAARQGANDGSAVIAEALEALSQRHRECARQLGSKGDYENQLESALQELEDLLQGCRLLREASPRTLDTVASYGERLSAPLAALALRGQGLAAEAFDARRAVRTDARFGAARVDREVTHQQLCRELLPMVNAGTVPVVTGFLGATAEGQTTTLGRGGSDYTASLVAAALDARAVELWTDVSGVLSADPRIVGSGARALERLSYPELMELSHFGAKVVHPPSIHPARAAGIPLWIKNTFDPQAIGTRVEGEGQEQEPSEATPAAAETVRGITSIRHLALLRIEGDGMVGVPGVAGRIFGALARYQVNVVLITQASSEHSISFAIAPEDVAVALEALEEELRSERALGLVGPPQLEGQVAAVACVGTAMRQRPGVASRVFTTLARRGISARAIAQGSSELNLSVLVDRHHATTAVRALHHAFFPAAGASPQRTVDLHLAGVGRVGSALLEQLAQRQLPLEQETGLRLRLASVGGRRGFAISSHGLEADDPERPGLDPATAKAALEQGPLLPLDELVHRLTQCPRRERILIDCTASDLLDRAYLPLLASDFSLVSANKLPFASERDSWERLSPHRRRLFYGATAGAGLPVVHTLGELLGTGDRLLRIEGLLSGTLTFLFDQLQQGVAFSEALRSAHARGYTEPDPREDLSGRDVARKLLILARRAGLDLAPEEITVDPILPPEPWGTMDLETFWQRLPEIDEHFAERCRNASKSGRRLTTLASLDIEGGELAKVALREVELAHPAAQVDGSDNLVAFTTERYRSSPLVVRGPGAGPAVTAAGVFGDILRAVGGNAS
ncbi:MAG: bifunctional aspartate kinase/homoserine dehydrogenase I [Acidobacteriota bacterium]